jgi:hypothetical protein
VGDTKAVEVLVLLLVEVVVVELMLALLGSTLIYSVLEELEQGLVCFALLYLFCRSTSVVL